jgi:hypothetical protein
VKNPSTSGHKTHTRTPRPFLRYVNSCIVYLTLLNGLLYWPWQWLRVSFDAGNHHPELVLVLLFLTLWVWWQLIVAVFDRSADRD